MNEELYAWCRSRIMKEAPILDYQKKMSLNLIKWSMRCSKPASEDEIKKYTESIVQDERAGRKLLPLEAKYFKSASFTCLKKQLPGLDPIMRKELVPYAQKIFEQFYACNIIAVPKFYEVFADNLKAIESRKIINPDYTSKKKIVSTDKEKAESGRINLEPIFTVHRVNNTYGSMLKEWMKFEEKVKEKEKSRKKSKQTMKKDTVKNKESDSIEKQKKTYDLDKIKQAVRIEEYARDLGFNVVRKGSYFSLVEHDSVMIDPERNRFWRNSNDHSGTIIDFVLEFEPEKTQLQVIKELSEKVDPDFAPERIKKEEKEKKTFTLIAANRTMDTAVNYLEGRRISKTVIDEIVNRKMLYESYKHECVFIGYNQNRLVSWGCIRGTGSQKFYSEIPGSDENVGYYIDNKASATVITEGCIDLLSYMTLVERKNEDAKKYNYLALGSCRKYKTAVANFNTYAPEEMIIAFDNDDAGIRMGEKLKEKLNEAGCNSISFQTSHEKDWNDDLCRIVEEEKDRKKQMESSMVHQLQ